MKTKFFRKNQLDMLRHKILRLSGLFLLCPVVLSAQTGNGVTVSNLVVNAGTVTFNVRWNRDAMPVALWSDSVWVFVDYNKAGKMERLPVIDATASAGTVEKIPGNDKGVWVIGNARTNGSFSATVQLLTTVNDVGGACAYASNYPPVGEYMSATKISFIGTPMYEIALEETAGGTTFTAYSDGSYTLPAGHNIQSFTDATSAPGHFISHLPDAASTQTWTYGNQIWSDVIHADPKKCTLSTSLSSSGLVAQYIIKESRYYYNYYCAIAEAETLCPSAAGWRIPNRSDVVYLTSNYPSWMSDWPSDGRVQSGSVEDQYGPYHLWIDSPDQTGFCVLDPYTWGPYHCRFDIHLAAATLRCVKNN